MIRTWAADISLLLDEDKYLQYYEKIANFRKKKADKIMHQEGKAQSVGVWTLLMKMREAYGVGEDAVYNLSHSGTYVLCSLDDCGRTDIRIGCDIEAVKDMHKEVAKRFFCEAESDYILTQKKELEKSKAFYRYWVLKESFMKATRLGMKLGLDEFEFAFGKDGVPYLIRQPKEYSQTFYFQEYELVNPFYKIAVCSDNKNISKKIETIVL